MVPKPVQSSPEWLGYVTDSETLNLMSAIFYQNFISH